MEPHSNNEEAEHQRPETHLWTDVRQWLEARDDPPAQTAPISVCPICSEELDIRGLPRSASNTTTISSPAMYTQCGHIFCNSRLYASCATGGRPARCPMCRKELRFREHDCEHIPHSPAVPPNLAHRPGLAYLTHMPRTILEGGAQPARCNRCSVSHNRDIIERAIQRLDLLWFVEWHELVDQDNGWLRERLDPEELAAVEALRVMRGLGRQHNWSKIWDARRDCDIGDV